MSLNVLIVDDSGVMRKMIRQALDRSGLSVGGVYEAANGREALDLLERERVDVALLDLHMPVMTGEELYESLRASARHADLPVVFVSSESSAGRIQHLMEKGAGFVHKPWSAEDLRAQIESVTEARRG
jgi:two-component system chemotaxis response regulator CheY